MVDYSSSQCKLPAQTFPAKPPGQPTIGGETSIGIPYRIACQPNVSYPIRTSEGFEMDTVLIPCLIPSSPIPLVRLMYVKPRLT